jgi:hypothetical protein
MTTVSGQKEGKLNQILKNWPRGTVAAQPWLESQGIYRQLARTYLRSDWVERVGRGAYRLAGDRVSWTGGLYAIQHHLELPIHAGARTALELQGYAHFLPIGKGTTVWLFGDPSARLPAWFQSYGWDVRVRYVATDLFPADRLAGLTEKDMGSYHIRLSSPERAMMEVLALVPQESDFEGAQLLMEGLTTVRPALVQELLENCRSVKVKRLFMHLAEKSSHPWVNTLDRTKINFGKGKRMVVAGGRFDSKYGITVPA